MSTYLVPLATLVLGFLLGYAQRDAERKKEEEGRCSACGGFHGQSQRLRSPDD